MCRVLLPHLDPDTYGLFRLPRQGHKFRKWDPVPAIVLHKLLARSAQPTKPPYTYSSQLVRHVLGKEGHAAGLNARLDARKPVHFAEAEPSAAGTDAEVLVGGGVKMRRVVRVKLQAW